MAGHSIKIRERKSHGSKEFSCGRNSRERNQREKARELFSRINPIPNQRRCAHVLRIAAVLNQPLTRTPTRTPCGEAGSEDSWLRVLGRPTKAARRIVLIARPRKCPESYFQFAVLICEIKQHDASVFYMSMRLIRLLFYWMIDMYKPQRFKRVFEKF